MKDETRSALLSLGMDLDQTLARFVGNEALLLKFLKRFLEDKTYGQLTQALAERDAEAGFHAAHTLKGVAGNLGLGGVFNAISPMVEALRSANPDSAGAMFEEVAAQYALAIQTIQAISE